MAAAKGRLSNLDVLLGQPQHHGLQDCCCVKPGCLSVGALTLRCCHKLLMSLALQEGNAGQTRAQWLSHLRQGLDSWMPRLVSCFTFCEFDEVRCSVKGSCSLNLDPHRPSACTSSSALQQFQGTCLRRSMEPGSALACASTCLLAEGV